MAEYSEGTSQIPPRVPRGSAARSQTNNALALGLSVVAVIAGFFILRNVSGNGAASADFPAVAANAQSVATPTDESTAEGEDATGGPTTVAGETLNLPVKTDPPAPVVDGASVMVVNANGRSGSAGAMTNELRGAKFTTVKPGNRLKGQPALETSVIYYKAEVPAAEVVARSLAGVLGSAPAVQPMPETVPVQGELNSATVVLMLGTDFANKKLVEINPPGTVVSAPPPQS